MSTARPANAATDDTISCDAFAAWAEVYDHQPNPLLSLEERCLGQLLPEVRGLDVVDIGCGTGRWLARLRDRGAHSLTGIDSSPEMVERARIKLGISATVVVSDAASLQLGSHSGDVVLISFVVSYVHDLLQFASEIRRVARNGARLYITDLHPVTTLECNWKRGFKITGGAQVEIAAHSRSIEEVISCFEAVGFKAALLLEPPFGDTEQETLRRAGKLPIFHEAGGRPAIYILQLNVGERHNQIVVADRHSEREINLAGARVAFGPDESSRTEISIANGQISSMGLPRRQHSHANRELTLNLDGYLLLPGLTNSHDHLEFGLFPNLGHGPYTSFEQWADDIHQTGSDVIARHRRIPKDVRLWWGAIRNLLCGVTTVCHHNPLDTVLLGGDFPVRVLTRFGWAHSVAMDSDLLQKFHDTPLDVPFILHAAEGVDEKSAREVFELDRIQALDERTVLVHGLALGETGIALLNRRGGALVWCPTSNQFLFGQTHSREALAAVKKLVLGSDSSLTAAGDLSDEIRYAHGKTNVNAEELYRMVVTRPATIFHFDDGRGAIRPEAVADVIAVRDTGASPAGSLVHMSSSNLELVVVAGRVQLASDALFTRLPVDLTSGLQPLEVDGLVRWIRAPLGRLFGEAQKVLQCPVTLGGKKVRHVATEWI